MSYSGNLGNVVDFASYQKGLTHVAYSDQHVLGMGRTLNDVINKYVGKKPESVVLVGDRTGIDYKTGGRSLIRDAAVGARLKGQDVGKAVDKVWSENRDYLVREQVKMSHVTKYEHECMENLITKGKIPQVIDTVGNSDLAIEPHIKRAYKEIGKSGITNMDVINGSNAFRRLNSVESKLNGNSLTIYLPFSQVKDEAKRYADQAKEVIKQHKNVKRVYLFTHENPYPTPLMKRKVQMKEALDEVIDKLKEAYPNADINFICGHLHILSNPYNYKGVRVVPIGYSNKSSVMRVYLYNPETGREKIVDVPIRNKDAKAREAAKNIESKINEILSEEEAAEEESEEAAEAA